MKIKSVDATWLRVPIPEEKQHTSDFGRMRSFDTVLVRIETVGGLVGHGEAKAGVGNLGDGRALVALIGEELGGQLIGKDASRIAGHWEEMYNGSRAHFAIERGHVFPALGRRGLTISAISGIDIALWDILGQSLNVPIWQLLGGKCRDDLAAYASGGWAPAEAIGEQLAGYIEAGGFGAVKMRVGSADGDALTSARRVAAARKYLGEDVGIMADAHGTFDSAEAKRFCRLVTDYNLAWFEEPVTADDIPGCAEVRASTDIPIAAGESIFTRFDYRDLALARAVDIFQPDLAICGGITEAMRIAALATSHQIRLAPHMWGGAIMFAAGLHICATAPAAFIVEYSLGHNPLMHDLVAENFPVVDGRIEVSDRPGLGLTIDTDFVRAHAVS
ncbi:MAG: mandelate racemase/muconate lactonizing enzyme family protein [Rhodospirillaceae bacterium]|jgi:L-alanine-DL-glutamate epimerase-like enolase superfamily enzyme|nr:mandelate racemase/muconate lactonizing enzyme family protein [Rhodospirillaceae bacterium]MBT5194535.1 mandelate racemase/muconate lactonizing enzyme family protein [Rhodospirillaceae bacterium]MBT5898725.1 mandelate racemase/muconate lactonizing enzyme family protein [Rhodospirillaceae bacterium]MBT6430185.1 mandelate racemase/muconate lactonizing enzyme family protein [Rhodospirillaceae bacterium]